MAHFAELDENNSVLRVVVVSNDLILDDNSVEQENIGIGYLRALLGGVWKQTSYNGNFRSKYAGIGDTYDADLDEFVTPEVEE
jgi:hypothetical protein